jgi:choline dehydrogenase-like flavoprotein
MTAAPTPAMPSFGREEVEVCIVGSGSGGGPLALELARAGARVVVLEKGPWYRKDDFDHDEIANMRLDKWVPRVDDEPHLLQLAGDAKPRKATQGWIANCVGGGTVHWSGFVHRMHPDDFRLKSATAASPRRVRRLAHRLRRLGTILRQGRARDRRVRRGRGTPVRPAALGRLSAAALRANPLSALIDQGARGLGLHPFQTLRAILSRPYAGRPASSTVTSAAATDAGRRQIQHGGGPDPAGDRHRTLRARPRSMAFEVTVGRDGRARAVRYFDAAERSWNSVRASSASARPRSNRRGSC